MAVATSAVSNGTNWDRMPEQLLLEMSPNFIIARGVKMGMNQTWIDRYVEAATSNKLGEALFARYNIFSESDNPALNDSEVISAILSDLDEYNLKYSEVVEEARLFYSASASNDTKRNISDVVANYNGTASNAENVIERRDNTTVSIDGLTFGISCSTSYLAYKSDRRELLMDLSSSETQYYGDTRYIGIYDTCNARLGVLHATGDTTKFTVKSVNQIIYNNCGYQQSSCSCVKVSGYSPENSSHRKICLSSKRSGCY